jgi:hypothetical protein
MYADLTLESVALDTHNNEADATDAPAKRAPAGQVSHFLILSHRLSPNLITNALT